MTIYKLLSLIPRVPRLCSRKPLDLAVKTRHMVENRGFYTNLCFSVKEQPTHSRTHMEYLPFKHAKCKFITADLTSPADELTTQSISSAVGLLYIVVCFLLIISETLLSAVFNPVAETAFKLKDKVNRVLNF